MIFSRALVVASVLLLCFSYSSKSAHADVNQFGVDCSLTPWMSSCAPDYSDMNEVNISDDGRAEIDLPFTFPMFDQQFTKSWMYSNGVVGFMSAPNGMVPHFCCAGMSESQIAQQLANASLPQFAYSIAALWTDLIDINSDHDGDGIDDTGFYYESYDTNNDGQDDTMRYFWRGISQFYNPSSSNTFEVKIDEVGLVEITHFEINIANRDVTVGVFGGAEGEYEVFQYDVNINIDPTDGTTTYLYNFDFAAACAANPLFNPSCTGYAEAYAELIYNQSCSADPLYDSGCPGYQQAYYNQQCSLDPLYDTGCSGYEQAYYDQQCSLDPLYDSGCTGYETAFYELQCSLNPLYDSGCTGYAEAYYNQQCTISALYDSGCPGYETAYYNQQCSLDPLYDTGCNGYADAFFTQQCGIDPLYDVQCPGYEQAYYLQQCEIDALYDAGCNGYEEAYFARFIQPELERQAEQAAGVESNTETAATTAEENIALSSDPVASITEVSITGDSAVDDVLSEPEPIVIDIPVIEPQPITEEPTTQEIAATEEEPVEEIIEIAAVEETEEQANEPTEETSENEGSDESSSDVEQQDDSEGDESNNESTESESDDAESDSGGDSKSEKSDSKDKKKSKKEKSKEDKLKEIATKKAMMLAETMSTAATLEAQQAVQTQILSLINYVPDFLKYGGALQGGYYADATSYPDKELPQNPSALRNGLAQQLLHEKMVDMQYER